MSVRIAHITPTDRIAYLMLRNRLAHLRDYGYDISIICGHSSDSKYEADLHAAGFNVIHVPFEREIAPMVVGRNARTYHMFFKFTQCF